MMNVPSIYEAFGDGVKTITLGQKMFEFTFVTEPHIIIRPITAVKFGTVLQPSRAVEDFSILFAAGHPGMKIGQVEERARCPDGDGTCRIEAEEEHARLVLTADVGSDLEFRGCDAH